MGECSMLQGLGMAGVTGAGEQGSSMVSHPIFEWSPGDNLWVLLRVGDTGLDQPGDFCQGSRSAQQLRGERVWLRKPRVDKGTALLAPPCALSSLGTSLPNCPIPPGSESALHHVQRSTGLGEVHNSLSEMTFAPDTVPDIHCGTLPVPTPKPCCELLSHESKVLGALYQESSEPREHCWGWKVTQPRGVRLL